MEPIVKEARIFSTYPETEYHIPEGCFITEIMNRDEFPFSVSQARVEPAMTTVLHSLSDVFEAYYILSGSGLMEIDGGKLGEVVAGDVVPIAVGTPQRITNTGKNDLVFLCICSPRFQTPCYNDLENLIG